MSSTARANCGLALRKRAPAYRYMRVQAAAAPSPASVPPAWPGYVPAAKVPKHAPGSGPKPISLIGSTGSIGTQTLDIVAEFPDQYRVVALSAGSNITLLADQVCVGRHRNAPPHWLQRLWRFAVPAMPAQCFRLQRGFGALTKVTAR